MAAYNVKKEKIIFYSTVCVDDTLKTRIEIEHDNGDVAIDIGNQSLGLTYSNAKLLSKMLQSALEHYKNDKT